MPTPEALVAAAQGAGARISRRRPPAAGAGGASTSTSAAPTAGRLRQDLSSATDGKIIGRGGREQELGAAAQRRLAAFRPPRQIAPVTPLTVSMAKPAGPAPPPGDGSAVGAAPPAPAPAPGGAMPPDPGAIMSRLRVFRGQMPPSTMPPEPLEQMQARLDGGPGPGSGPMEADILPALTDAAVANPLPGGDMSKPMFGAPTATAGPAPWDELAGAVARRRRPMGGAGERSGGAMGDLGGASY